MITIEYLNKYEKDIKNYDYEVQRLKRNINSENSKTTTDSVSGSSSTYPYIQRHYEINGRNEKRIKQLEKRKKYFENKKKKLEEELEYKLKRLAEEDSVLADIVRLKYIDKLEWKQVAIKMKCGYSDESGPRKKFERYFNKNKTCPFVSDIKVIQ